MPQLLTPDEAAGPLRRNPATLRRLLRDGTFPGVKVGGRWFISSAVLDRVLAGKTAAAGDPDD